MAGKFELKKSKNGKFMFNLRAGNNQVILTSETYNDKDGAQGGIESVRNNANDDARYERRNSTKNEPYFVLKAINGEIIGTSEMYSSASAMENGIASVKANGPGASVVDMTANG